MQALAGGTSQLSAADAFDERSAAASIVDPEMLGGSPLLLVQVKAWGFDASGARGVLIREIYVSYLYSGAGC